MEYRKMKNTLIVLFIAVATVLCGAEKRKLPPIRKAPTIEQIEKYNENFYNENEKRYEKRKKEKKYKIVKSGITVTLTSYGWHVEYAKRMALKQAPGATDLINVQYKFKILSIDKIQITITADAIQYQ